MTHIIGLASLALGAAFFSISQRTSIPVAPWIALTLLVHGVRVLPAATAMPSVWMALFAALAVGQRGILPASGPPYFAIVAAIATLTAAVFAVDKFAVTRLSGIGAVLVFPAAWVAMEFLQARLTPAGTWGSIAYTQYGNSPLIQLAAVTGIWGVTFLVAWLASTVDYAWTREFEWAAVRGPVLVFAATTGLAMAAGMVRLALAPTDRAMLRAATLNRPRDLFVPGEMTQISEGRVTSADRDRLGRKLAKLHDWFLEGTSREARAGARLVVWPEGNLLVFSEDEASFLERARRLAAADGVYLAMGMGTIHVGDPLPFENKLVLIDPSGSILMSYRKSHAVAGWEAGIMKRGDGLVPVVATDIGRIAGMICFDGDFPEFVRQAPLKEGDLLVLPVNDWREVKERHFQMAAFRSIESGLPLVRAAASGLSAAFDPWGRVLAISDYFAPGDGTMTVQVPVGRVPTLYSRIGDSLPWCCAAGVVLALAIAAGNRVKSAAPQAGFDRAAVAIRPADR